MQSMRVRKTSQKRRLRRILTILTLLSPRSLQRNRQALPILMLCRAAQRRPFNKAKTCKGKRLIPPDLRRVRLWVLTHPPCKASAKRRHKARLTIKRQVKTSAKRRHKARLTIKRQVKTSSKPCLPHPLTCNKWLA